VYEMSIKTQHS